MYIKTRTVHHNIKKLLTLLVCVLSVHISFAQCEHPDYEGLIEFYDKLNGKNWNYTTGWDEGKAGESCDPCNFQGAPWEGLKCENDRVVELDFANSALSSSNNVTGPLYDIQLSELRTLSLHANRLSGAIPNFTGLPQLEKLVLSSNDLNQEIPDFSAIPELKHLDLNRNKLSGEIPDFSNLAQLESLILSLNSLEGMPNFSILPELTILNASYNNFLVFDNIDFSAIPKLHSLYLRSVTLPDTIHNFSNLPILRNLSLSNNDIIAIGDLSSTPLLETIDLSNNNIKGAINSFPALRELEYLNLSFNDWNGELPSYNDKPKLISFEITGNGISGILP